MELSLTQQKMKTEEKQYPKGTTKEQWDSYEKLYKAHMARISIRKFELDRMIKHLKFTDPDRQSWTLDAIHRNISAEISASESMDAPNKPGYHRANND